MDIIHSQLASNCLNEWLGSPLVKIPVSCPLVERYGVQIKSLSSFCFMKCLLTSICCLVQSCYTRLWTMLMVDLLSQYNFIVPFHFIPRSLRMILNQSTSQISCVITLNSASALDLATTLASYYARSLNCRPRMCSNLRLTFGQSLIPPNLHQYMLPSLILHSSQRESLFPGVDSRLRRIL